MESVLLNVAGYRRSPATMPGYTEAVHPETRASSTRPIRQRSKRSWL
jgi:hypothetical protein